MSETASNVNLEGQQNEFEGQSLNVKAPCGFTWMN